MGVDLHPPEADLMIHQAYTHVVADLADAGEVERLMDGMRGQNFDGVIHCAVCFSNCRMSDVAEIRRVFEVNLFSALSIISRLHDASGRTLTLCVVSSPLAYFSMRNRSSYSASKAALERLVEGWQYESTEGNHSPLRVIGIRPGIFNSTIRNGDNRSVGTLASRVVPRNPEVFANRIAKLVTSPHLTNGIRNSSWDARFATLLSPIVREMYKVGLMSRFARRPRKSNHRP